MKNWGQKKQTVTSLPSNQALSQQPIVTGHHYGSTENSHIYKLKVMANLLNGGVRFHPYSHQIFNITHGPFFQFENHEKY
jgi:hypothetical protein